MANDYDLLFDADIHFLAVKADEVFDMDSGESTMNQSWEDRVICEGVAFKTNYRTQFSQKYSDQIIEQINLFNPK